jgi:hypothetical protein
MPIIILAAAASDIRLLKWRTRPTSEQIICAPPASQEMAEPTQQ